MTNRFPPGLSRRRVTAGLVAAGGVAVARAAKAAADFPRGDGWSRHRSAEDAGFVPGAIAAFERALFELPTTSALIVRGGKIAYSYGDISEVSYLASARKSVLSMLYGRYVAQGLVRLDSRMSDLGIDEDGGLLPIEQTATVRDLLMSSSGVYFPAASIGSAPDLPTRGAETPGAHFAYNNWDFNVLGAILERATKRTVFDLLERDLARPTGFEDYDPRRQHMLRLKGARSRYAAYHLFLSARDCARLGLLMVRGGHWATRSLVPESWVQESTTVHVPADKIGPDSQMGYGYLWWIPTERRKMPDWRGAFLAAGNYGQYILGLPALDTVIVHRRAVTDAFAIARNLGDTNFAPPGVNAETFLALADRVVEGARSHGG